MKSMRPISAVTAISLVVAGCASEDGGGGSSSDATGVTSRTVSASVAKSSSANTSSAATSTNAVTVATSSTSTGGGVSYFLEIRDVASGMTLPSLTVCQHGATPANCTITDQVGIAQLAVPPDTDFVFSYSGPGYRTHLLPARSGAPNELFTLAVPDSLLTFVFTRVGVTEDISKGAVLAVVSDANGSLAGATGSLTPASGVGPVYSDNTGLPTLGLTSTTTAGSFAIFNVDPGMHTLAVERPPLTCATTFGFVAPAANATIVPVVAGALTLAPAFGCM